VILAALALASVFLAAPAKEGAAPKKLAWEASFASALQKAKTTRKPVMIDFWAEWCGYCHRLDKTTYRDATVVGLSAEFVSVKVNTEGSEADQAIASRYLVRSLPTILFVTPEGRHILRLDGYLPPRNFVGALGEMKKRATRLVEWEGILAKTPEDKEALTRLALHQFSELARMTEGDNQQLMPRRMYEDVRDLLTRAYREDKDRPLTDRKRVRVALALMSGYKGEFPQAEAILQEAIALPPSAVEDAKAHLTLGEVYLTQEKKDPAVREFRAVTKSYPNLPESQAASTYLQGLGLR
jgi:thioredoxin-like negative regulator of GroEL